MELPSLMILEKNIFITEKNDLSIDHLKMIDHFVFDRSVKLMYSESCGMSHRNEHYRPATYKRFKKEFIIDKII